jgi:anti-sigma factor RsiW
MWLSLELDGELSAFERRLLSAHLRRCDDCQAYEVGIDAATAILRSEPMEPMERPVRLPPARTHLHVVRVAASAAAAAFLAVAVTGMLAITGSKQHPRFLDRVELTQNAEVHDLKQIRLDEVALQKAANIPVTHVQLTRGE